jgi:hypothetical protein
MPMELSDLLMQVSALLGTSLLVYIITAPSKEETPIQDGDRPQLKGIKRYSSYHRQRYSSMDSSVSSKSS